MGLYFEDFASPEDATSRGRTVTEADVMAFAGLTGDFTELHTNEEYAKTTTFGRRIAHGALVFGISIGLTTRMNLLEDTLLAFAGVDKLRFVSPVFIGDTIHVVKRVVERQALGATQGTIVFESRVLNQRGELVLVFRDKLLVKRRGGDAPSPSGPGDQSS
ncbi:MAG TPA: MaoC/PaaZ C-terminal domain-containing protein [Vicinamibacterales bacterium]|nr:MaoC/PaaZ C-terminal domain-containing protein [Vicinamibacterales bacterium]